MANNFYVICKGLNLCIKQLIEHRKIHKVRILMQEILLDGEKWYDNHRNHPLTFNLMCNMTPFGVVNQTIQDVKILFFGLKQGAHPSSIQK